MKSFSVSELRDTNNDTDEGERNHEEETNGNTGKSGFAGHGLQ